MSKIKKSDVINSYNSFGFNLLNRLIESNNLNGNVFISPFSVSIILVMLYNGADDETKRILSEIFKISEFDIRKINKINKEILLKWNNFEGIHLNVANSMWIQQGYKIDSMFKRCITNYYDNEIKEMSSDINILSENINKWVSDKTNQKIKNFISLDKTKEIIEFFINIVYFKGIWKESFEKNETKNLSFILSNGKYEDFPTMKNYGYYDYYENDIFQAINLPYKGNKINMSIFLPRPLINFKEFQNNMTLENLNKWLFKFKTNKGSIFIPKLKIKYKESILKYVLPIEKEKILKLKFDNVGIHSKFLKEMFIDYILHAVNIETDEEGTEASVATLVGCSGYCDTIDVFYMVVNRPFFCIIRDNETGIILFMGYVFCPSEK